MSDPIRIAEERIEVAEAKGLPRAAAKRLVGSTRAELEADAASLARIIGRAETAAPTDMNGAIRQAMNR